MPFRPGNAKQGQCCWVICLLCQEAVWEFHVLAGLYPASVFEYLRAQLHGSCAE